MKRKIGNTDMPIGRITRISDFLPPPSELIMPDETVKVTLLLRKSSVDFLKSHAKQYHIKYQRMIREVVDKYVIQYS